MRTAACLPHLVHFAVMDRRQVYQCDACVVELVVVPVEELLRAAAGVLQGAEPHLERPAVLRRAEVRLRIGIIIGAIRTAVGAFHLQVRQELHIRLNGGSTDLSGDFGPIEV